MQRRSFLFSSALSGVAAFGAGGGAAARPLVKPRALRQGDTVALVTPATYVSSPEALQMAQQTVEYFGLKWKMGRNAGKRTGYLGGSVEERVEDLHAAFADDIAELGGRISIVIAVSQLAEIAIGIGALGGRHDQTQIGIPIEMEVGAAGGAGQTHREPQSDAEARLHAAISTVPR